MALAALGLGAVGLGRARSGRGRPVQLWSATSWSVGRGGRNEHWGCDELQHATRSGRRHYAEVCSESGGLDAQAILRHPASSHNTLWKGDVIQGYQVLMGSRTFPPGQGIGDVVLPRKGVGSVGGVLLSCPAAARTGQGILRGLLARPWGLKMGEEAGLASTFAGPPGEERGRRAGLGTSFNAGPSGNGTPMTALGERSHWVGRGLTTDP